MFGKHLNATRKRVHPAYKTGKKEKEKKKMRKNKTASLPKFARLNLETVV